MAEVNTPRVMAAAREFNIGKDTLVDFLVSKGFEGDELKPGSKISEEMYRVLQVEFQPDKAAKQKAEQIDLPKNAVTDFFLISVLKTSSITFIRVGRSMFSASLNS